MVTNLALTPALPRRRESRGTRVKHEGEVRQVLVKALDRELIYIFKKNKINTWHALFQA